MILANRVMGEKTKDKKKRKSITNGPRLIRADR